MAVREERGSGFLEAVHRVDPEATGLKVGRLLNFGSRSLEYKRLVSFLICVNLRNLRKIIIVPFCLRGHFLQVGS